MIAESYANIRQLEQQQEDLARTQPITVRALETMIRLATAHAKGRMSRTVDVVDAEAAIELVQFAYFKKIIEKPKKKKSKSHFEEDGDEEEDEEEGMDVDEVMPKRKSRRMAATEGVDEEEEVTAAAGDEVEDGRATPKSAKSTQKKTTIVAFREMDDARFKKFKSLLNVLFQKTLAQQLSLEEVYSKIMEQDRTMDQAEIDWALDQMQNENQVMVADGEVFLI